MYGPLIYRYAREARGHGVPEVMIAVVEGGGRIRPQVSGVRALASALCIGTGGSVGREGPIVQIGSALASSLGQWVRMPDPAGLPHSQPDPGPGEAARHNGSRLHRNGDTAPQRLLRAARQGVHCRPRGPQHRLRGGLHHPPVRSRRRGRDSQGADVHGRQHPLAMAGGRRGHALLVDVHRGRDQGVPTVANTLPDGQTDYGCREDYQTRLADGDYAYVIGSETQEAAISRVAGATFLPFSTTQTTRLYILLLRNKLINPGFTHSAQNITQATDPSAASAAMGPYYPEVSTCALSTLTAKGLSACESR